MRISDWSSDVCSSDLLAVMPVPPVKIIIGLRHWMNRAPVRVVRGDDALDGGEAIIKPAGGFMQIVEQALVICGKGGSGLPAREDRKSVVLGKSVSVRVDLGGRRILKKKKKIKN